MLRREGLGAPSPQLSLEGAGRDCSHGARGRWCGVRKADAGSTRAATRRRRTRVLRRGVLNPGFGANPPTRGLGRTPQPGVWGEKVVNPGFGAGDSVNPGFGARKLSTRGLGPATLSTRGLGRESCQPGVWGRRLCQPGDWGTKLLNPGFGVCLLQYGTVPLPYCTVQVRAELHTVQYCTGYRTVRVRVPV